MSVVYVIGAGASHGESLKQTESRPGWLHPPPAPPGIRSFPPPLTNGFFSNDLLNAISYSQAEKDFKDIIQYICETRRLTDAFGENVWKALNLEDVFTSLEVEREFQNPESDTGAHLLLVRNKLTRYIRRILGLCTQFAYGEYYRLLHRSINDDDSIITFNWDLLLDQEFIYPGDKLIDHYSRFFQSVAPAETDLHWSPANHGSGLLLKLHGSLNWFRCGNRKCQANSNVTFVADIQSCLSVGQGIGEMTCRQCGSEMNAVIVPPLLRKPIGEDSIIRSAWGLARTRLLGASRIVVIGFSAAPTDFYTSWLLRSTVGTRDGVEIVVINPCNEKTHSEYEEFKRRMAAIFLRGYQADLYQFSQISRVLPAVAGTLNVTDTPTN